MRWHQRRDQSQTRSAAVIHCRAVFIRPLTTVFSSQDTDYHYPSRRSSVHARNIVATSQPLATQAGLTALDRGGNAVDAAIASAITLTVVEPTMNGIGSDAFAIAWDGQDLHGLNASGRSPAAWTPARFNQYKEMPWPGWDCVTVPGAVDAWVQLSERFGVLPFDDLFEAAIRAANDGFAVSPVIAAQWAKDARNFSHLPAFADTFLPGGTAPRAGDIFRCQDQARTLEEIARTHGESFYRGPLAEAMATDAQTHGADMTLRDLADHKSHWVDCISQDFRDLSIHEIPPNGQGIATLVALGILEHLDVEAHPLDSADSIHLQLEAMKIAFAETQRHVADPESMEVTVAELLDPDQLARRAASIDPEKSSTPSAEIRPDHGTIYLSTADQSGMMVSYIQSNFTGFGSGIVVPGTGISLQSRGRGFVLQPGHANEVGGGKRPYHTIIPAFITRQGEPVASFGVMGGHMQPQGHLQMVLRMFCQGLSPQQALDAPRWFVATDFSVWLEPGLSSLRSDLEARGHRFVDPNKEGVFGGGQIIVRAPGGYVAGSDPRKDGLAGGF
ncbi:MAG TPA: gamma-glutamyltransferase family protein [Gammaproteobacteria bacterium]|nr:gamma-glutamyltransferase family protein [Gammaproteobacteria bacterium]